MATILSFGSSAREAEGWRPYVTEAAARFGLPEAWVVAVIAAESGGRTHLGGRPITSHAGAMGLMQIMPGTWAALRAQYGLGPDPHAPRDNIIGGTAYLRAMYDRFGYPGLFAAYNAGPGRYAEHLRTGRPLPRETRDYVAKVTGRNGAAMAGRVAVRPVETVAAAAPLQAIFFPLASPQLRASGTAAAQQSEAQTDPGDAREGQSRQHDSLFVIRKSGARNE
nr:lytic transglycosylase domain-containing protein [Sphingopyxis sp. KK2]